MSFQLQFKRYNTAAFGPNGAAANGLNGEIMIENAVNDRKMLRIFDGSTPGGIPLSVEKVELSTIFSNGTSLENILNNKANISHTHSADEVFLDTNQSVQEVLQNLASLKLTNAIRNDLNDQSITSSDDTFTFSFAPTTKSARINIGPTTLFSSDVSSNFISRLDLNSAVESGSLRAFSLQTHYTEPDKSHITLVSRLQGVLDKTGLTFYHEDGRVEIPNLYAEALHIKVDGEYVPLDSIGPDVVTVPKVDNFTSNGAPSFTYSLSDMPIQDTLLVFIEGVYQSPLSYTLNQNQLTLTNVPDQMRITAFYFVGDVPILGEETEFNSWVSQKPWLDPFVETSAKTSSGGNLAISYEDGAYLHIELTENTTISFNVATYPEDGINNVTLCVERNGYTLEFDEETVLDLTEIDVQTEDILSLIFFKGWKQDKFTVR